MKGEDRNSVSKRCSEVKEDGDGESSQCSGPITRTNDTAEITRERASSRQVS